MNNNKYMRGFVAGGIIGITAGVLLMPQMNTKTRKKILNKGMDMVDSAAHMMGRK